MKTKCKIAMILTAITILSAMLGACSIASVAQNNTASVADLVQESDVLSVPTITIKADGREITFEDAQGKTVQELLDEAEIELFEGDVIAIAPDQTPTESMTLEVLRRCAITIDVEGEKYTAVLVGGTVADALDALGIELSDDQVANFELDAALENDMEIVIEEKAEEVEEEVYEEDDDDDDSSSGSSSNRPSSGSSSNRPSSGSNSGSGNSGSGSTATPTPAPTPKPTPSRTVVSVQIYEDCDGSGHGVKVITYSDGSQEEIPY